MKCKIYLVSIALCIISEEKVNRTAKKCGIEKALNIIVDECDDRAAIMYKFEDDPSWEKSDCCLKVPTVIAILVAELFREKNNVRFKAFR